MRDLPAYFVPLALAVAVAFAAALSGAGGPSGVPAAEAVGAEAPAPVHGPAWRAGPVDRHLGPPSGVERLLDDALGEQPAEEPPLARRHVGPDGEMAAAWPQPPMLELLRDVHAGERDEPQRIALRTSPR